MTTVTMFASRRERVPFVGRLPGPFVEIGVGKARAAASVARVLAERRIDRVLLLGVAGAYRSADLAVGDVCVVRESVLADDGVLSDASFESLATMGFGDVCFGAPPYSTIGERLSHLPAVRANTVSCCSGRDADAVAMSERTGASIETMESAAVALACGEAGVELVELRGISNVCGDRAGGAWDIDGALAALTAEAMRWEWL